MHKLKGNVKCIALKVKWSTNQFTYIMYNSFPYAPVV